MINQDNVGSCSSGLLIILFLQVCVVILIILRVITKAIVKA